MAQPKARQRLYREFLTPALHRRFADAATAVLAVCYVESISIGNKSSCKPPFIKLATELILIAFAVLWSWFPLGPAGVRTLLLFLSALVIFILRVSQLQLGPRTTISPIKTFTQALIQVNTYRTFAIYLFSAWWFSEVYVWSASQGADLKLVAQAR